MYTKLQMESIMKDDSIPDELKKKFREEQEQISTLINLADEKIYQATGNSLYRTGQITREKFTLWLSYNEMKRFVDYLIGMVGCMPNFDRHNAMYKGVKVKSDLSLKDGQAYVTITI